MNIPALLMAGLCLLSPKALALTEEGDYTQQLDFPPVVEEAEPEMTYIGNFYITGYDPFCGHCCGKAHPDGVTASGAVAEYDHTVAMCKDYPFGTQIYIDGLGYYTVEDRGVGRGCVDVACDGHAACYAVTSHRDVYLVEDEG